MCRPSGSSLSRPSEACRSVSAQRCRRCSAARVWTSPTPAKRFKPVVRASMRIRRSAVWSRPDARTSTALSTTNAAVALAPGGWRCSTGHPTRLGSRRVVPRQAAWQRSTTFGARFFLERSRVRPGSGNAGTCSRSLGGRAAKNAESGGVVRGRYTGVWLKSTTGPLCAGAKVEWEFMVPGATVAAVEATGFKGEDAVAQVVNAIEGFSIVLCDLKTLLESGRSANLVTDKAELVHRSMA